MADVDLVASALPATLGGAAAMLLRGHGAVDVGSVEEDAGAAVVRMHLLLLTCDVWLRAHGAGAPTGLTGLSG